MMKQKIKDGFEFDCVSNWRKKGIIQHKAGVWKSIKKRLNKRFRKESKHEITGDK